MDKPGCISYVVVLGSVVLTVTFIVLATPFSV